MRKFKQSFVEIVAGEPRKEHFINLAIVVALASIVVWIVLELTKVGMGN